MYQQNLDCWTEAIEIGISGHGIFSSDSIENKVITTMKGGFYFTIGYKKQIKSGPILDIGGMGAFF